LEHFIPLFFAPGKPLVHRTGGEVTRDFKTVHLLIQVAVVLGGFEFLARGKACLKGGADEIGVAHPGNLHGVLESEEQAGTRAGVRLHAQHVDAIEEDLSLRDLVIGMAGDHFREGAFARAVGAHDRVDGAFFNFEIEAAEDLLAADDTGMEVVDDETHKGWLESEEVVPRAGGLWMN